MFGLAPAQADLQGDSRFPSCFFQCAADAGRRPNPVAAACRLAPSLEEGVTEKALLTKTSFMI
jgi:hypothetical protein